MLVKFFTVAGRALYINPVLVSRADEDSGGNTRVWLVDSDRYVVLACKIQDFLQVVGGA